MYKFKISSMNCMSCVGKIEKALKAGDQNVRIEVDLRNKAIYVQSAEDREKLTHLIKEAGYEVDYDAEI